MKTLVLLVLLCIILPLDAKQKFTQEGVNISLTHSSNQYGSDLRSQSVSADLTGHTLTIEFNENIGKAHISIINNTENFLSNAFNYWNTGTSQPPALPAPDNGNPID